MTNIIGLTQQEVIQRINEGKVNSSETSYNIGIWKILRRNFVTPYYFIILPVVIVLILTQNYKYLYTLVNFALLNSLIGIIQEVRARRKFAKIKFKYSPETTVIRDGLEMEIKTEELVIDDVIKLKIGDSVGVDGEVISSNYLYTDESLLTGESEYIFKNIGDKLLSGSFIVAGNGFMKCTHVGAKTYQRIYEKQINKFQMVASPIERKINRIFAYLIGLSVFIIFIYSVIGHFIGYAKNDLLTSSVSFFILIVPQTLIFMFSFNFLIALVRLANKGALLQRSHALDALADIDVLCIDKTGTITDNTLVLESTRTYGAQISNWQDILHTALKNISSQTKTIIAIDAHLNNPQLLKVHDIKQEAFTSANKNSQISFHHGKSKYKLIIGAYEKFTIDNREILNYIRSQENKGLRVVFSRISNDKESKVDIVFSLREKLKNNAIDILKQFKEGGVIIKIISGDSPYTLKAIAKQLDLGLKAINTLPENIDKAELNNLINSTDIFARTTPEQKKMIIAELRKRHTVGMIGDGVNDVLALKEADLGIAMRDGSKMANEVADIILIDSDFAVVPHIIYEGKNIVRNLATSTELFLIKSHFAVFLAFICLIMKANAIFSPASLTVSMFLAVSLPSYIASFNRRRIKRFSFSVIQLIASSYLYGFLLSVPVALVFVLIHPHSTLAFLKTAGEFTFLITASFYMLKEVLHGRYRLIKILGYFALISSIYLFFMFNDNLSNVFEIVRLF